MADYFVYRDENGDFGYASKSFYSGGSEYLLDSILLVKEDLSELRAKNECRKLNNPSSSTHN